MDTSKPPGTPTGSNQNPIPASPPKYVPQFSAATEMILKRIQSGAGVGTSLSSLGLTGTPPPGYEDMRRSVLQGMKTTFTMEISTAPSRSNTIPHKLNYGASSRLAPNTVSRSGSGSLSGTSNGGASKRTATASSRRGRGGKAGVKRRRKNDSESDELSSAMSGVGDEDEESEFEAQDVTELPKITQSGRQVNKPTQFVPPPNESSAKKRGPTKRTQEQTLCQRCQRGHSPAANMIVFCDGCNMGWHQMCHDPIVSDTEVKDETATWFCTGCARKRGIKPAFVEVKQGVSWAGKSLEQKRLHFASLNHQQLVNLLLQATSLHPNLPLFPATSSQPSTPSFQAYLPASAVNTQSQTQSSNLPSERRTTVYPQQPFPPSATSAAGLFSRAEANPQGPINFIRKVNQGPGPSQSATPPPMYGQFPSSNFSPAASAHPTVSQQHGHPQQSHHGLPSQEQQAMRSNNARFQGAPQFANTMAGLGNSGGMPGISSMNGSGGSSLGLSGPGNGLRNSNNQEVGALHGEGSESRESTPPSPPYPKAGQGLMAKLGTDEDAMEWLVDDDDYEAFSHTVYDDSGRKVEDNARR